MWPRVEGLRAFAFGDESGPLRQRLQALALAGIKVATADLEQHGYIDQGEAIETVGERQALIGDDGEVVAIVEITRVEIHRFVDVPWEFAQAEGEGFRSIEHWRDGHRSYFAEHSIDITDDSRVVCVWFRLAENRIQAV
jgi:uncharacterized protein YhfF